LHGICLSFVIKNVTKKTPDEKRKRRLFPESAGMTMSAKRVLGRNSDNSGPGAGGGYTVKGSWGGGGGGVNPTGGNGWKARRTVSAFHKRTENQNKVQNKEPNPRGARKLKTGSPGKTVNRWGGTDRGESPLQAMGKKRKKKKHLLGVARFGSYNLKSL